MSEHIVPEWDVEKGQFIASTSTVKGLPAVEGDTREAFEKAVVHALPEGTRVVIEYADRPVELVCQ